MGYSDPDRQREYQRNWVAARRAEWLEGHGPCLRCGSSEDLEVDHIDGSTKVDHKVWSWSAARRDEELKKCQVLCRKCHLEKSRAAGEQPAAKLHGNPAMYEKDGCRCELCREGHRVKQREYRHRQSGTQIAG